MTSWTAAGQDSLSITNTWSLLKRMSIESVMPSNHLILCLPLLLPPSIFPSIRDFQMSRFFTSEGKSIGVSPSASFHPMNYSGLVSFRMDCLDFLAVQGTLRSLLQHHSSKASILQRSTFFIVQLSHPYMTTGKSHSFDKMDFFDKGKSLLFNILSRLVVTFLPWSKRFLISWLHSPSAVTLKPKKIKSLTLFPLFALYLP